MPDIIDFHKYDVMATRLFSTFWSFLFFLTQVMCTSYNSWNSCRYWVPVYSCNIFILTEFSFNILLRCILAWWHGFGNNRYWNKFSI